MPQNSIHSTGLLLIGHGTRDKTGVAEAEVLLKHVREACPKMPVELSFLEITEPTIFTSIERLVKQGIERIIVTPLLLFTAGHAKNDVPELLEEAVKDKPNIRVISLPPFGCDPAILELSDMRLRAAELISASSLHPSLPSPLPTSSIADRMLLVIGRGASDPAAIAQLREFSARRATRAQVSAVLSGFVAMAKPDLKTALQICADSNQSTILVQPHLLFTGRVLADIREAVEDAASRTPDKNWLLSPHLGPDPQIAKMIVERMMKCVLDFDPV
jgi:sirohydrochlorin cobaltochelatase